MNVRYGARATSPSKFKRRRKAPLHRRRGHDLSCPYVWRGGGDLVADLKIGHYKSEERAGQAQPLQ